MRVLQERLHKAEAECSDRSAPPEPESSSPRLQEQLLSQQLQSAQTKVQHRLLCLRLWLLLCLRLWLLLCLRLCQWLYQWRCQWRVSSVLAALSVALSSVALSVTLSLALSMCDCIC